MATDLTPAAETARYIDGLGAEALAKAQAYTLGNHLMLLAGPSLISPLFNKYEPVPAGEVRTALEAIADNVGIPPRDRSRHRPNRDGREPFQA